MQLFIFKSQFMRNGSFTYVGNYMQVRFSVTMFTDGPFVVPLHFFISSKLTEFDTLT